MKELLAVAAASEAALGVVLLVHPSIVVHMLFGAEISGAGIIMGRIAGIALIALGAACWSGRRAAQAPWGMLIYSVLATLYLAHLGIGGEWVGVLLWPTVVVHAIVTLLLAYAWRREQRTTDVLR